MPVIMDYGGNQAFSTFRLLLVSQMSALDQLLAYDFEADQEFEVSMLHRVGHLPPLRAPGGPPIHSPQGGCRSIRERTAYFKGQALLLHEVSIQPGHHCTCYIKAGPLHRKTGLQVTLEDYISSQKGGAPKVQPETQGTTKELSFAEIKYLIENNKADLIPNNKNIPDVLNVCSFETLVKRD